MKAGAFYKAVTVDDAGLLDHLLRSLHQARIQYCVIGGQGVNAYVEPLVSLDLDLVVTALDVDALVHSLPPECAVERFAHSVNLSMPGSGLRVQIQTDPRYAAFLPRAAERDVLGAPLRVAALPDVLMGKIWAAQDPSRRASKRQKDLADIARIIERFPELRGQVPPSLLEKLL